MWSSPARLGRLVRSVEGATGRTVTEAIGENIFAPSDYRPYGKRLGPHRGAVVDALEDAGGELHLKELCEVLHRKRPWDVRRRILQPLEEAGIIECEGDVIRLAAEWSGRLEERRESDGEIEQAERQAKKHRRQGDSYRVFLERQRYGTPKASRDAVRRSRELRDRRLREMRDADAGPAESVLAEGDWEVLVAIDAFEQRYGRNSFKWNRSGAKELFYSMPGGHWPEPEQLDRIRDYLTMKAAA
jgi:hypothetical protein